KTSNATTTSPATAERLRRSWLQARCRLLRTGRICTMERFGARSTAMEDARLAITHSRIDRTVHQNHAQVDERNDERREEHDALDQWIVALIDGLDQQAADARPGEDRFGDDRAAEQSAHLQADDGDDRDECVGKRVAGHDRKSAQAFRTGRSDVVLAENLQ